ncbi:hypothetical protein GGH13_009631, partial [Coemansia sp. S155-1]
MRLPWVCHSFGVFLYTCFCEEYMLHFGDQQGRAVATKNLWPSSLQGHDSPTHRLAKVLKTTLDIQLVFKGMALQQLSNTL